MRSKHIAALITFFATFAFSAFIALLFAAPKIPFVPPVTTYEFKSSNYRCKKKSVNKIEDFLVRDKQNGDEMDGYKLSYEDGFVLPSSVNVFANTVSEYVAESRSMDDSRFPRDFQNAWREHMDAWMEYEEFLQASKNKRMTFEDFNSRTERYNDEISRTWKELLRIGREHGADLPDDF
jgi:hypothetical protein